MLTMMASYCAMRSWCRRCCSLLAPYRSSVARCMQGKLATKGLASAAVVFVHCQAERSLHLQTPDVGSLRQEDLLRLAADQNVDAVSVLLTQTTQALLQAEEKYRQTMTRMRGLLEHHLTVLGSQHQEDAVWDLVLQGRHRAEASHRQIQELQTTFAFVQKLTDASVEVASLAGSEECVKQLEDQLSSAQERLSAAREQSVLVERQLQEVQARSIQVIAEHAEKEERERKTKEGR